MDDESPPSRYLELVDAHGVLDRLAEVNLRAKESVFISFVFSDDKLLILYHLQDSRYFTMMLGFPLVLTK